MTEKEVRREQLIRDRANQIWLDTGGDDVSNWLQAEQELFLDCNWTTDDEFITYLEKYACRADKTWKINSHRS